MTLLTSNHTLLILPSRAGVSELSYLRAAPEQLHTAHNLSLSLGHMTDSTHQQRGWTTSSPQASGFCHKPSELHLNSSIVLKVSCLRGRHRHDSVLSYMCFNGIHEMGHYYLSPIPSIWTNLKWQNSGCVSVLCSHIIQCIKKYSSSWLKANVT